MPKKTNFKSTSIYFVVVALFASAMTSAADIHANDAVAITPFDSSNQLYAGESMNASGYGLPDSYTDNQTLNNSAWGVTGTWFTFRNHDTINVNISVSSGDGFSPGLTVWATGDQEFNGGTTGFGGEISTTFFDTPASFNATGAVGDAGTAWMANGQGGNIIETLAYAVSNPSINHTAAGWGETIQSGWHDVSVTNNHESGITGVTDAGSATLQFTALTSGWYTVYVGGTNTALTGGNYNLVISAVPESDTWLMLLAGLTIIGWHLRKHPLSSKDAHTTFAI